MTLETKLSFLVTLESDIACTIAGADNGEEEEEQQQRHRCK